MSGQFASWTPDYVLPCSAVICEHIEARGWSQADLARRCGPSIEKLRDLISRDGTLTCEMGMDLEVVLGMAAEVWRGIGADWQRLKATAHANHALAPTTPVLRLVEVSQTPASSAVGWLMLTGAAPCTIPPQGGLRVVMDGEDLERRRDLAVAAAKAATAELAALGVQAVVIGSLARGKFGPYSDIDLLVTECPRHLKYAIEGVVEDALAGFRFDVVYLDEVAEWKLARFTEGAVHASELCLAWNLSDPHRQCRFVNKIRLEPPLPPCIRLA